MTTTDTGVPAAVDTALRAAIRAPSVHNTQPWRFVVTPARIDLHLDRDRVLAVADPDAREARMSCGAALFNLRVALQAAGRGVVVDLLPDPANPDLLASVRLAASRPATPQQTLLAAMIRRRATNRRPFVERPVSPHQRTMLRRAAAAENAQLILLDTPRAHGTLATLLRRADHLQEQDPAFQAELLAWTTGEAREDGVPRSAAGPRPVGGSLLTFRQYGRATSAVDRPFEQEPLLAVLATPGDSARDQLRAGQAMQRVLLTATSRGLCTSFLSQPVEVPLTRAALRAELCGGDFPQTVLRIGYGYPPAHTPRRPVTAVTTFTDDGGP